MKLTKKQEREIMQVYDTWMHGYLNADVDTYDLYFDDDYHFIGSTNNEEFLNRKDTTDFFRATGDQFAGMTDLRNETKTLEQFDNLIFLTHIFDAWFKNDKNWTYYGKFRFSSVMKKRKEGWRFIYQHFSMPDSKSEEGQTIGFDKVNAENQELRDAIKRRTVELEQKNRELEIEGALGRIRAQAVAMKTSSELLDIVVTMRNEFTKLGHEAHYFWHMMWLKDSYEKAMTSGDGTKIGMIMKLPRLMHGNIPVLAKWEKSKKPIIVYPMDVETAVDYIDKMIRLGDFQQVDPQAPSLDDVRHIGGLTFIMARTTHGEIGFSLPGVVKKPPIASLELLEQFAGAFDLAHRRFLDLKKAEKQARETQIELALEKVRSRTMAMQHSDELQETSFLLDEQVRALDIKTWGCAFNIYGEKESTEWFGNEKGVLPTYTVPRAGIFKEYYKKGKKGESLFVQEFSGKACVDHYEYMSTLPVIGDVLKKLKETNNGFPTYQIDHVVYFKYGYLLFITKEHVPDAHDIFKRFAKVFEQTYTRFLDLQKAEAQAKEAQIELGLERVRARAMAMQHSNELSDLVATVLNELTKLDFSLTWCIINIINEAEQSNMVWATNPEGGKEPESYYMKFEDYPFHHAMMKAWKAQKSKFVYTIEGKEKKTYDDYLYNETEFKRFSNKVKKANRALDRYVASFTFSNFGGLQTVANEPLSDKNLDILARFGKVFDLTYTRFNDLQKAEAQTKEAQIETALERVRSRSMAMHKSEELKEVVKVIFDQMAHLKINADHAGIVVDYEPKKDFHFWVADNQDIPARITVPYLDLPWDRQFTEAKKKGTDFFTTQLDFEEKNSFYKKLLPHIEGLTKQAKDFYLNCPGLAASTVIQKDIGLYIENFSGILFSDEENSILMRFGKVFQQTYTRFLDLQKAESQAREAQIENTLEKVRSRTMAMHKSEELAETALVLYEQFTILGNIPDRMSIGIFKEETKEIELWSTDQSGSQLDQKFTGSWEKSANMTNIYEAWKADNDSLIVDLSGQKLKTWLKFIREEMKLFVDDSHMMGRRVQQAAFFSHGMLLFTTNEPIAEEIMQLLIRFARVFSQTYTRFLDLQKAEAQAREAQIEHALEKVRSRTMAMQNSSELPEAANNLFLQVQELGIPAWSAGYCIWEDNQKSTSCNMSSEGEIQKSFSLPTIGEGYNFYKPYKNGDPFHVAELGGKKLVKHYDFMKTLPIIGEILEGFDKVGITLPTFQIFHIVYFTHGYLMFITYEPVPDDWDIFKRFGSVFEQTFTRFLDLQKAEAQTKEAKIEMALEKVRSRTMAMQKGEEVKDVVVLLYKELIALGVTNFATCGYVEINEETQLQSTWVTSPGGDSLGLFYLPLTGDVHFDARYDAWKKQQTVFHQTVAGKERKKHLEYAITTFNSKEAEEMVLNQFPDPTVFYCFNFSHGYLHLVAGSHLKEEEEDLLARFTRVFEQTYARFLDLEKAEAQVRESQIEAALEKVRSRSLAMHKPDELQEVIAVVAEKLKELGVIYDAGGVILCTYFPDNKDVVHWIAVDDFSTSGRYFVPYFDNPIFNDAWDSKIKGDAYFSKEFPVEAKNEFFKHAFEQSDYKHMPEDYKQHVLKADKHNLSAAWSKNSAIIIPSLTGAVPSESDAEIMKRFAKVFEQAYIRFLDLQKTEAQAREAQIETALEKVRSRSLAMHKSKELREVVLEVHEKFQELDISMESRVAVIVVFDEDSRNYNQWIASDDFSNMYISTPYFKHKVLDDFWIAKEEGVDFYSGAYTEDEKNSYFQTFFEISNYKRTAEIEVQAEWVYDQKFYAYSPAFQKNSSVGIADFSGIPLTEGEIEIIKRFSKVFEQAYIRFMDLQKAEAQAREAQIEGALERVRSKTMAMHNSEDLEDIVVSLFDEVLNLGLDKSIRCGIGILEGHEGMETRSVNSNSDGAVDLKVGMLNMTIHPMLVGLKKAWKKGSKGYSYEYIGKDVRKYYKALNNDPGYPFNANLETLPEREFHRSFFYSSGILFTFSETPISEESARILARFAAVFGQTYRRFLDLQTAEAQAREATKQASLDRVRGQIASMRSTTDLDRITPLVWNELTTMSVPFIRCGVFIIDETTEIVQAYLSAPDGHSLGVLHLRFNADPLTENTVAHWQKGNIFKKHWNRKEFISWTQSLIEQGKISDKNTYQGAADPPESLDLHFIPFTQGMLYVGSKNPLNDKQIDLVQSLADAFAIAYARYEDFTKLEKAKQSVETTLSELKATQNQLVQSEKMASLGELTAGIAHEIQNPLNFVNNFSEVSVELIEEMHEELEKGDLQEAIAISEDVKQNLEKINHHGKRADGIVKGMLQHSRSSSGQKEPTDINALADEYLRLAYHGLRAKDKSFNATLETDYDNEIGKIEIIPQDIGRVILNLITNAFYVVKEKKERNSNGFEPTVAVSTKKKGNMVLVTVKDNGNGIPKEVLDKIFQPFFTTKPTGKGTGLGLSMSYDIVTKGHGGELKVETKEGKETTFTIALPMG
ncbi:MAG: ATP-binding protein [Aureibaculum sp.]|nr:ATP-binding protein [Aureibaculum sp.]